jgi:shikimate kinase
MLLVYWPPWVWKSTVWKELADTLHLPYFDLDQLIVLKTWNTIANIMAHKTINWFRDIETETLWELLKYKDIDCVVSMGWGTLTHAASLKIVKESQQRVIILMMQSREILFDRIEKDTENIRPLLEGEDPEKQLRDLMDKRKDHYMSIWGETKNTLIYVDRLRPKEVVDMIQNTLDPTYKDSFRNWY